MKNTIFLLMFLFIFSSCSVYKTTYKIDKLLLFPHYKDCDDYEFILHFVDEALRDPDNIYEISKKYPITVYQETSRMFKYKLQAWNFSIKKLYERGKINKTYHLCYEQPGYSEDQNIYTDVDLIYKIKDKDLYLAINFHQSSKNAKFVLGWIKLGDKKMFPEI